MVIIRGSYRAVFHTNLIILRDKNENVHIYLAFFSQTRLVGQFMALSVGFCHVHVRFRWRSVLAASGSFPEGEVDAKRMLGQPM